MPRVTVFPNGVTASFPRRGKGPEEPVKRGKVQGWSVQSTRRLRRWFYSIDGDQLTGQGVAVTLTVRDLPPTAADWTRTHRAFLMRLRRAGLVRGQWLTEWQRRGVPHLHGAFFFPGNCEAPAETVLEHWLAAAADWSPAASGQHVTPLWGLPGWLQYQAKHSVRGVKHYQRAKVPAAWREGTGRLWGVVGEWPTREEVVEVSSASYHRFRRLMRSWLIAEARRSAAAARDPEKAAAELRRAAWLRGLLRDPEKARSRVRAVGEFCPEHVARNLLAAAELRTPLGNLTKSASTSCSTQPGRGPERRVRSLKQRV